jgi:hypothetical protein
MRSMTSGGLALHLEDLVRALLRYDSLAARQWIADAARAHVDWPRVPEPRGLDAVARVVAAGVMELLASRAGCAAPAWTAGIGASAEPILLVRAAATMPHLRRLCEAEGPEPLRSRGVLAPPDFLTAA